MLFIMVPSANGRSALGLDRTPVSVRAHTAGDEWDIGGTLLRPDGKAFDLTDATIIWMLRGPDGLPALQIGQYAINLGAPLSAGLITIVVEATTTAAFRPGRYLDWLRVTDTDGTDTFWSGMILVSPNPWGD